MNWLRKVWTVLNRPLFAAKVEVVVVETVVLDPIVEVRKAEKARRLLEKAMRLPVNDVVIQVQNGEIELDALFSQIDLRVKEGLKNGR